MMHGSMNIKGKRLYSFFIMSTMALGPTQPPLQCVLVAGYCCTHFILLDFITQIIFL
jgi:hypothetical protein